MSDLIPVLPPISLVVATRERTAELSLLLKSLSRQRYTKLQVVVVDQNEDERLAVVLRGFADELEIRHVRSKPGLSHARNVGLEYSEGAIVGFPDDDCQYPDGLLRGVAAWFEASPEYSLLITAGADKKGVRTPASRGLGPQAVTLENCVGVAVSYCLFMRSAVTRQGFDESLGVGAGTRYGSGEDSDFALRVVEQGLRVWFEPGLVVLHPNRSLWDGAVAPARAFRYSVGVGRVLRIHQLPAGVVLRWMVLNTAGAAALSLLCGRVRACAAYSASLVGRVWGYVR